MNLPKILQSSRDAESVSLTIKGALVLVPSIVALGAFFGWHLDPNSLTNLIDAAAATAGAVLTLWGAVRKFLPAPAPTPPPTAEQSQTKPPEKIP